MSTTQTSSSHGKLIVAVIAAALVVVLALVSAFIWPGWALNKGDEASTQGTTTSQGASQDASEPTTPSIDAVALPDDASELLKAMPDSVLNFARTKADASTSWSGASPVEEYTLTYSTGKDGQDITLKVAQWSQSKDAQSQYDNLTGAMTGKELGGGNVKVSGEATAPIAPKPIRTTKPRPSRSGATIPWCSKPREPRIRCSASTSSSRCDTAYGWLCDPMIHA